ncbi:PREDICTED: neutrophil gelatinase-associated lipocalin-like [Chinchilla lanigera]|uniref:neutrophil gelatinase-associated lipocalin-like n=1 Tax=Chinchilla lanigera TaxID=34839 RepID=UPI000698492F|nr:PREDICTED: neutrophil gelatinase-associated lipocalin-like [Chinchilla lanigera]
MALGLLCVGLTLLGALQIQAQDQPQNPIPVPSLSTLPLQADFKDDQFQGKWYVIGMAGNSILKGSGQNHYMYSDSYKLNDDHSYNVKTRALRDQECTQLVKTFVPYVEPGQFVMDNMTHSPGLENYIMRVTATDYNQFAVMYIESTFEHTVFFQTKLTGRTKELSSELKERFVEFSKSLGLSDDNIIFLTGTGNVDLKSPTNLLRILVLSSVDRPVIVTKKLQLQLVEMDQSLECLCPNYGHGCLENPHPKA